jgi:hypothetical protein
MNSEALQRFCQRQEISQCSVKHARTAGLPYNARLFCGQPLGQVLYYRNIPAWQQRPLMQPATGLVQLRCATSRREAQE